MVQRQENLDRTFAALSDATRRAILLRTMLEQRVDHLEQFPENTKGKP